MNWPRKFMHDRGVFGAIDECGSHSRRCDRECWGDEWRLTFQAIAGQREEHAGSSQR